MEDRLSQSAKEEEQGTKLPWGSNTAMVRVAEAMQEATRNYVIRMENLKQALADGRLSPEQFRLAIMRELRDSAAAKDEAVKKVLDEYAD